jgi:uncharacterized protein YaaR (DUF327 family)
MADLTTVLSSGAFSSALFFLFRNWISERIKASIEHEYAQKLETHKAQLKSQTDIAIVRLKADLEIAAMERNVRFSKIFERMAETIAETYKRLVALKELAGSCTELLDSPLKAERMEAYRQAVNDFLNFIRPNTIYIPAETSKKVATFFNTLRESVVRFSQVDAFRNSPAARPDKLEAMYNAFLKVSDEIPDLLDLLAVEFQSQLGVATAETSIKQTERA